MIDMHFLSMSSGDRRIVINASEAITISKHLICLFGIIHNKLVSSL